MYNMHGTIWDNSMKICINFYTLYNNGHYIQWITYGKEIFKME